MFISLTGKISGRNDEISVEPQSSNNKSSSPQGWKQKAVLITNTESIALKLHISLH